MNILITGATGFIGSFITTKLLAAGHSVTCCVRNIEQAKHLFPTAKIVSCDFTKDTLSDIWLPRVKNMDIVINCIGILYHPNKKIIWAIHNDTPRALFSACVTGGVKKIIQISALGIDQTNVNYATSKKAAEEFLLQLPIQSIILRPSFVYAKGSYGGSSLFRGLSGLPFIIPMPGKGQQQFQPIHLDDLAKAISHLMIAPQTKSIQLDAVGPERITLKTILTTMRDWLGFKSATLIPIPLWVIRMSSFFGSLIPYSSMNSTSVAMMQYDNVTSHQESTRFNEAIGFTPDDFQKGIYSQPSSVQDHWHARLYFLKPLLQVSIAFVWMMAGICSALLLPKDLVYEILTMTGIRPDWQPVVLYGTSLLDVTLGLLTLVGFQLKRVGIIQCLVIVIYTLFISWKLPELWIDPFGAIAKNIPLLVATLVMIALESDR